MYRDLVIVQMTLGNNTFTEYKLYPYYICYKWKPYSCSNMCKNCNDKQQKFKKYLISPMIKCNCSESCNKWLHSISTNGQKVYQIKGHFQKMEINKGKYSMEKHHNWKGGIIIDKDGYELVRQPDHTYASRNGYIRKHRLVMEKKLGRYLTRNEVVHHIDKNKLNNDVTNLELVENQSKHRSEKHLDDLILIRVCSYIDCKQRDNPIKNKKGRPRWFKDDNGNWVCFNCYRKIKRLEYKP